MDYAKEILDQLGGNRFRSMTGAKHFGKDDNKQSISFKIGRNCKQINYVTIKLTSMDLYNISFIKMRKCQMTKVEIKGIYFDQLQSIFTENTGLNTIL